MSDSIQTNKFHCRHRGPMLAESGARARALSACVRVRPDRQGALVQRYLLHWRAPVVVWLPGCWAAGLLGCWLLAVGGPTLVRRDCLRVCVLVAVLLIRQGRASGRNLVKTPRPARTCQCWSRSACPLCCLGRDARARAHSGPLIWLAGWLVGARACQQSWLGAEIVAGGLATVVGLNDYWRR